jgi:hypothetical protein
MKHKVFAGVFTVLVLVLLGVSLTNNYGNTMLFLNFTTLMIPAILADILLLNDQAAMIIVFGVAEFALAAMLIGNVLAGYIEARIDEPSKTSVSKARVTKAKKRK